LLPQSLLAIYEEGERWGEVLADIVTGFQAKADRYMRYRRELPQNPLGINGWVAYANAGHHATYRDNPFVLDWRADRKHLKDYRTTRFVGTDCFFREGY
jgi:hypothetical protein